MKSDTVNNDKRGQRVIFATSKILLDIGSGFFVVAEHHKKKDS